MKKERSQKMIYLRFIAIILVSGAIGAAAGAFVVMAEKNLMETAERVNRVLASFGLWWFIPGYLLLLASTASYFRGKGLLPQAKTEDAAFREADRRLCLSQIFSGAAWVWLLVALGISMQTNWAEGHVMWMDLDGKTVALLILVSLVVQLVWVAAIQAVTVKATKEIYPEKRGNVLDTKFQKDWYQSCDEAERQQIGQCSYFSFRVMSMIFPLVMVTLVLLAENGMAKPSWILLVGGLWMVQQMSYLVMAYQLDHGKKKNRE